MDLHIDNASLEEITLLCHRLGDMSFWETLEADKNAEIKKYESEGMTKEEATEKHKQDVEEKAVKLHLDAVQKHTRDDLAQIAGKFVKEKGANELRDIIRTYGVNAIPDIKDKDIDALCKRLKEGLND